MTYPNALTVILTFFTGCAFGVWLCLWLIDYGIRHASARSVTASFKKLHRLRPNEFSAVFIETEFERESTHPAIRRD